MAGNSFPKNRARNSTEIKSEGPERESRQACTHTMQVTNHWAQQSEPADFPEHPGVFPNTEVAAYNHLQLQIQGI